MPTKNSGSLIDKINCYLQIAANDPHSTTLIPLAEAFRQIGLLEDALSAARLGVEALPNFVITSYSIHYTKLYEVRRRRTTENLATRILPDVKA